MRPALFLFLVLGLSTAGCSRIADSRLNPFNWFGSSTSEPAATTTGEIRPLVPLGGGAVVDNRGLIANVTGLSLDRTPDGGILRVTGQAATQGQFNAQLVPVAQEGSTLTFAFRIEQPAGAQTAGSAATRTVTVARVLSNDALAGVRQVRVEGATNARVISR